MQPWTTRNAPQNVSIHEDRLRFPYRVKIERDRPVHPLYPLRIFVNSMSDLFHPEVPDSFIARVFEVMADPENSHIIFQVLTKRSDRAATWPGPWPLNIWLGATSGHPESKHRLDDLRRSGAQVRYVSAEPLLASLGALNLDGIDQVIVGGESGSRRRPMDMGWAREIRDHCVRQDVAFFFKQDSAFRTETRCYLVEQDGSCWQWRQFPADLSDPVQVQADREKYHRDTFQVLVS
jgi:protein gp37